MAITNKKLPLYIDQNINDIRCFKTLVFSSLMYQRAQELVIEMSDYFKLHRSLIDEGFDELN